MGGYKCVIFLRLSVVIYGYKRLKWRKVSFTSRHLCLMRSVMRCKSNVIFARSRYALQHQKLLCRPK